MGRWPFGSLARFLRLMAPGLSSSRATGGSDARRRGAVFSRASGEKFFCDVPVDVGEAVVTALEAIGELCVVEAELVQNRRVQVVHVDGIFGDVPRDVVGLADDLAAFDAAASEPEAESVRVMIAAGDGALAGSIFTAGRRPKNSTLFIVAVTLAVQQWHGAGE